MLKTDKYRFERISVKDGLPSSAVPCILQSNNGFMWFGTNNGLSRYDGHKFINYTFYDNPVVATDSIVTASFEDSDHKLWFGTSKGVLLEYNFHDDCFLKHSIIYPENNSILGLEKYFIIRITEDLHGNLWIITNGGLFKFNKTTKTGQLVNFLKGVSQVNQIIGIRTMSINSKDELMIGTRKNGIYILNVLTESCENITLKSKEVINPSINSIQRYNEDNYLILTSSGLCIFNGKYKEIRNIELQSSNEDKPIFYISLYLNEKLLISLFGGGLMEIDLTSKESRMIYDSSTNNCKIENDRIISLYKDRSDVIWMGTLEGGLLRIDLIKKKFFPLKKFDNVGKEFNMVHDLKIDREDNLWIRSFKNGLFKRNLISNKDMSFLDGDGRIIFEDSKDNIWVSSIPRGLFKYIKDDNNLKDYGNLKEKGISDIFAISEYHKNSNHYLLLGTNKNGITCLNTENELIHDFEELYDVEPKIKNNTVHKMYLDKENNLWVCVFNDMGVTKISLSDFSEKNYYPWDIGNIFEDKNNNMWFGTTSGLVKLVKNTKQFQTFDTSHGLPDNKIYGLLEDNIGNIWVTTRKTISKFDIFSETFRNYEYQDDLLNEEFWISCCKDRKGTLYFGGLNGIDYFNPDQLIDNPHIPNIVITDFQINNESVIPSSENSFLSENINYAKEINLSYKENVFSFEFAALIFNNPKQNQYAYMMEGFDKDWVYSGTRRTATYTNLDPGEYIFRVKGSNNDGVWNEEGTSIKITITPPYWKTWWFKGLGALSLATATGVAYKNRIDKIEKEKKDLEEFSRKRIESQENERKRIAGELHDTIAHEVLIAKNKAEIGLKHSGDKEKVENTLREILELSSATIKDVRNISYNLHPHQLERLGFTKTIRSIVNDVSNSTDIDFSFESDSIDGHLTKESEINLFRVIQESINNMIKHSDADKAEVKLMISEDYILVMLKDNGKGINIDKNNLQETKGGFGLSGMKERIKYMKGEIHIESEENKGTSIIIRIPVKR